MPTGYDARQGGRTSFADEGINPVQTTTGASADSRGAQQVGGESIGGVQGGQFTAPEDSAFGLGQFFEKFMAPAVARKQQAAFFKGYTEAQSGKALNELTHNGSPLTKIFGPSGFAQGAQFYASQTAISKWQTDTLADADTLKKMAPEELSKYMSDSASKMMTGDPYADQHIQAGLLEAQGPVIQTIAKARFGWQQDEMVLHQGEATASAATSLQQIAAANAGLGEKADNAAVLTQATRYAGLMGQPHGMTDDSYEKFLTNHIERAAQDGNFYAIEVLRQHHVEDALPDDKRKRVEDAYDRYATKSLNEAAQAPDITDKLLRLDAGIAQDEMDGKGSSVATVTQGYAEVNQMLRQRTGIDKDYFTAEDIRSGGGKVMGAIVSQYKRQEARAQSVEDRNWTAEQAAANKQAEADAKISAVRAAWNIGNVTQAETLGMSPADFDTVAMQDFTSGKVGGIANAFVKSGFVSGPVAKQIQTQARSGIGSEYTKATDASFKVWQQFHQANPELAHAYYGDYDLAFQKFAMLKGSSGPEIAYHDAFATVIGQGATNIPPQARKEYDKKVKALISDTSGGWAPWKWGNYTLNGAGQQELVSAIGPEFAASVDAGVPRSTADLAKQAYNSAIRDGRFEQYGVLGWRNTQAGPTVAKQIGLQGTEASELVQSVVAHQLKQVGVAALDNVRVIRTPSRLVIQYEKDGETQMTFATMDYLKRAAQRYVELRRTIKPPTQVHSARGRDY